MREKDGEPPGGTATTKSSYANPVGRARAKPLRRRRGSVVFYLLKTSSELSAGRIPQLES